MIETIYIHHDCFLVKTPDCAILFDFWIDPMRGGNNADPSFFSMIDISKPLFVVVSHHHKDHYTKEIFSWADRFPRIQYIISKDTFMASRYIFSRTSTHVGPHVDPSKVWMLRPGESWPLPADHPKPLCNSSVKASRIENLDLRINAFGSTDIGNSYLIETAGIRIFHAGDLNAWIWKDESTPEEVEDAIHRFNLRLDSIHQYLIGKDTSGRETEGNRKAPVIDLAFFPVDSRIGTDYWTGARIFLQRFDVRNFLPMHFALGSEEEQKIRRRDAARFSLFANPGADTTFIGPLAPYGAFIYSPRHIGGNTN